MSSEALERARLVHLTRPEDRELLRQRAEHDLTAECVPKQSCLEPEVAELGAVVLALLAEVARLEQAVGDVTRERAVAELRLHHAEAALAASPAVRGAGLPSGSASAAADEPGETP